MSTATRQPLGIGEMEAANWTCAQSMARVLIKRHRDSSTVQAMLYNEFGKTLTIDHIDAMRTEPSRREDGSNSKNLAPILGRGDDTSKAIAAGSHKLLVAIMAARKPPRIMIG